MGRPSRAWWQRAALRTDEDFELERRVSWLELFFDLVFVVVIARLSHSLALHLDAEGLLAYCLQFAAIFWAWNGFTYYNERFESNGLENRLFTFAAMATVAGLAVWAEDGLGSSYQGFALAYLATRLVNMVQWIRAALHEPRFRPVAARFVGGFLIASALVLGATAFEGPVRWVMFGAAILVEIAAPSFTVRLQAKLPRLSSSKFPERFGLLTMIVLGESIVGVITGLSELNEAGHLGPVQLADAALGLGVGIGLWWLYFDFVARRSPRAHFATALGWVYLHLVVLAGITATGAGISAAIAEPHVPDSVRLLLGGSVALALLGLAGLELTLERRPDEPTHTTLSPALKVAVAVVALITMLDVGWTTTPLLAVLVAVQLVPMSYGAIVWYRRS